jgi:hypothetical protein
MGIMPDVGDFSDNENLYQSFPTLVDEILSGDPLSDKNVPFVALAFIDATKVPPSDPNLTNVSPDIYLR